MKKLRGHKPGCKCVGCSAETRRRGMKALGLGKTAPKSPAKRARALKKAIARLAAAKSFPNPKRRKSRRPHKHDFVQVASGSHHYRQCLICQIKKEGWFPKRKPAALQKRNLARKPRRHANPAGNLIGTSPVLHTSRGRFAYKGRLVTGPGEYRVTIICPGARRYPLGLRVSAIDYRHDAKALRSYGKVAPFRHRFTSAAKILSSGGGRIVIESMSRIWEKQ